jgi:hypothetical protein
MRNFLLHVLTGCWFLPYSLFTIMVVTIMSSTFIAYKTNMKSALDYDQAMLKLVWFFFIIFNFDLPSQIINNFTATLVMLFITAIFNFFRNLIVWLALTKSVTLHRVWQMCFSITMASTQSFAKNTLYVSCLSNFPHNFGIILEILMGYTSIVYHIVQVIYTNFYIYDDIKIRFC